jgi:alkylation response protein AidB-like acyl-CoA dehydrogenase
MALEPHHEAFREAVRDMARSHVAPIADHLDRTDEFPAHLTGVFGKMGLIQLAVPEAYGGPGGDLRSACLAREEVARAGSLALGSLVNQNGIVVQAVLDSGSDELKARLLTELAEGQSLTCIAITEPDGGSDPGTMRTRGVRHGDEWLLNGSKEFITWAGLAKYALVFARTNDAPGARGISAFVIDTDQPGWIVSPPNRKMGNHGLPNNGVVLQDVRCPAANMVGSEGTGFRAATHALHVNRPTVAAGAVGAAQGALDYAIGYMKERAVGGRSLTDFQGLRWIAAEDATLIAAARGLVYECATLVDSGAPEESITMASSMAKLFAADMVEKVTSDALQLLGGHGYMQDHPVERYLRDARLVGIYEGTSQVQKNIIAKRLF